MLMKEEVIKFLNKCNIPFENEQQLVGMLIPREILLSKDVYAKVREDLEVIRKIYSSSSMTGLQQTAAEKERWPLLNLVRQLLKVSDFQMKPIRMSDGYTKEKKKKYKRFFKIDRYKELITTPTLEKQITGGELS